MKKIKFAVFGLGRGFTFFNECIKNGGDLVAVCDADEGKVRWSCETIKERHGVDVAGYTDFDSLLEHEGLEAVMLCNCFHEHAPFAIKALERGIHVLSECTSNSTMAEGVALVRAAEKSNAIYMLAENYPFMIFNQEMRRVYRTGSLGEASFCEGEYNHPINFDDEGTLNGLRPYPKHWRNYVPATYYITHSLAPLMYITGGFPKRVTAMPVFKPINEFKADSYNAGERTAIVTTLNDNDSVYRVIGWGQLGAHDNSYRICGTKGQIENVRGSEIDGGSNKIMLRYNGWQTPEGQEATQYYVPEWPEELRELAESAGHGGGDFFVIREFFSCILEGRRPEFDEYFATTCASVAIQGHRSMLEFGMPYDIPDFHKEEDRVKYENDTDTPFWGRDGSEPTMPCTSRADYKPDPVQYANYLDVLERFKKK